jgi:hypothetical protein
VRLAAVKQKRKDHPLAGFDKEKHILVAKPNCKHCYGRGNIGWNATIGFKQPCSCLRYREKTLEDSVQAALPNIIPINEQ